MANSTPISLTRKSQKLFIEYYNNIQISQNGVRDEFREALIKVDKAYQREVDLTKEHKRAQAANDVGDTTKFQNIVVPVVMPQVETAVTYQASVFLTGEPIFGVVAEPRYIQEAMQLESVLTEQSIKGGWTRQLILFFRDGFKYNFAPLEVTWKEEVTYEVATDVAQAQGVVKSTLWSGNAINRLDPYNTFVDPRVPPSEVYKRGEYAGYTTSMSRIALKEYIATLPEAGKIIGAITPALESGSGSTPSNMNGSSRNYYVPDINPRVSESERMTADTNWLAWAGMSNGRKSKINYKDSYERTVMYCKVLPSEFELNLPNANTPRIYKLVIINHQYVIYCELQTNAHNYLPILIGQPLEDGLDYQTKSLAENGEDFQDLSTSYMTSIIQSRRRAINDRVLFDPSKVSANNINSPNASAKIPVRPASYGKPLSEAVFPFPYREDQTAQSMQQIQMLLGLANTTSGQNQAQQGQFVKGNKTLHEYDDVMRNAGGRDQLAAILIENQVFMPLKHILKVNILQYQGGTSIYNRDAKQVVEVDPVALRKAVLEFRISDGLVPADKLLNTETFSVALQVLGSSPQIASSYNIGPLFSYLMNIKGADLGDFEKSPEQQAYEQAMAQWQQIAQLAVEKGADMSTLPPQPVPQQYGYDPKSQTPAAPAQEQVAQQAPTTPPEG